MKTLKSIVLFLIISLNYNIVAQTASQEHTANASVNVTTEELDKNIDKLIPKAKKNKLIEKQLILLTNSYFFDIIYVSVSNYKEKLCSGNFTMTSKAT